jgi:Na+-driven multidrug efflux pump
MWKKLFEPVDMTQGDPVRQIVKFMIPMLIGNIFQQLYNTVDSIVVGKYIGDNALAAVGSASPILNLLLVLFMGISVGAGIMVSQYFGAKQRGSLSHAIGTSITMMIAASSARVSFFSSNRIDLIPAKGLSQNSG